MNRRGRTKQEQEALRIFKGMRVVDADDSILISPNDDDALSAVAGDPTRCTVARFFQRAYGSSAVVVLRTVAYVDLAEPSGERVVRRFKVPTQTLEYIIRPNDEHGRPIPGTYKLLPPTPGQRLEHQAKIKRAGDQRRREARIKGELRRPKSPGRPGKRGQSTIGILRDGGGMVQMRVVEFA